MSIASERLCSSLRQLWWSRRGPELLAKASVPSKRAWATLIPADDLPIKHANKRKGILLREFGALGGLYPNRGAFTKSIPILLQLREGLSVAPSSFVRITGTKAKLDLAFADKRPQIIGDTTAEPIDAALRMFPGTSHCEGHVYHPCVPIGRLETLSRQGA